MTATHSRTVPHHHAALVVHLSRSPLNHRDESNAARAAIDVCHTRPAIELPSRAPIGYLQGLRTGIETVLARQHPTLPQAAGRPLQRESRPRELSLPCRSTINGSNTMQHRRQTIELLQCHHPKGCKKLAIQGCCVALGFQCSVTEPFQTTSAIVVGDEHGQETL